MNQAEQRLDGAAQQRDSCPDVAEKLKCCNPAVTEGF
jgi:hypothetical protein